jgi:Fe-S oxidoreductase
LFASASDRLLGISRLRKFPQLHSRRLQAVVGRAAPSQFPARAASEEVIFLSDPFTEYFYPEVNAGQAALRVLALAGCQVHFLPVVGSGRTMISKGFLRSARKQASRVVEAIHQLDPEGKMAVVGVEPSEIYTLRDEYQDLLPGERRVGEIARRAYMIDEFLVRRGPDQEERIMRIATMINKARQERGKILLHGHCYQKAQLPAADGFPSGVAATVAMLKAVGYQVSVIEAGCCGMAGAFGYERDHYDLSMKIGENGLFPPVRNAGDRVIIAAAGISCQAQIESGTAKLPVHPITLVLID